MSTCVEVFLSEYNLSQELGHELNYQGQWHAPSPIKYQIYMCNTSYHIKTNFYMKFYRTTLPQKIVLKHPEFLGTRI